jgi:acyl transferase domain-containing protein
MSVEADQTASLSPIKRALRAVEDMQAKLDAIDYAKHEPIAIIGMGCRFPGGANSPEQFWHLLRDGVDAITEVPPDRWNIDDYYDPDPNAPGKMYNRAGGFLDQIDRFDPLFFGISAREAASLDPQQRLLLEVSWEALEQANQSGDRIFNSATGVFIGICTNEYKKVMWDVGGAAHIDAFCASGNALSVAAGRLSYVLGLKGPNLAVDTACSSSLVAVHLACQQLRLGECRMALAGGVNLLLSPETNIAFAKTQVLDPDSRCKTFDASASGYVRGEGCGVIVLKRLSDAFNDGDTVLAVIRGSAVNHNGRSGSLVAPNGPSQQAVLRQALENGKVDPAAVSYIEVQGTSPALGQPVEIGALEAVFAKGRTPDRPLRVGSVKTNLGHLEGASGIASLIKVVLCLQHGEIPPHLHFQQPNPHINWQSLPFTVPTERTSWLPNSEPRLAGVSSFGFSGTNAHVILAEAPPAPLADPSTHPIDRPQHLLTLSAKTEAALMQLVERYEKHCANHADLALADICFSANTGRSHFQHRLILSATSLSELGEKLAAFSTGQIVPGMLSGKVMTPPNVVFYFGSTSSDIRNKARQLYQTQPTFRQTIDQCDQLLPVDGPSLLDQLYPSAESVSEPITHPFAALFIVEYALAQLWRSWGVEPAAVMGENAVGEVVAACVAGVFSIEAGLQFMLALERSSAVSEVAPSICYAPAQLPILSAQTGQSIVSQVATADYWCKPAPSALSNPTALKALAEQGYSVILEIAPQPTTTPDPATLAQFQVTWVPSLDATDDNWLPLLRSLMTLYVQGGKIDWSGFDRGYARRYVQLPTYPWQHKRCWFEVNNDGSLNSSASATAAILPLVHDNLEPLMQQLTQTGELSEDELRFLPKLLRLLSQSELNPSPEPAAHHAHSSFSETAMAPAETPQLNQTQLSITDIQAWMVNRIAKELGVAAHEIDIHAPFDSYGLDSVLAIGIASAGKQFLGIEVTPLMLVHYPSIAALAKHLATELEASEIELFEI